MPKINPIVNLAGKILSVGALGRAVQGKAKSTDLAILSKLGQETETIVNINTTCKVAKNVSKLISL